MNDDARTLLLGVLALGVALAAGWLLHGSLWRRRLRRRQRFFGLPANSECLLVVNRQSGAGEWSVARHDALALLELSALIKDCEAHLRLVAHDQAQPGFGERTEFCIGGPASNQRSAAHLQSMLPGVRVDVDGETGPRGGVFTIGTERYAIERGAVEYVLLARLTVGGNPHPVFLVSGQSPIDHQAAARYLARHHRKLARKYGTHPFCLLLKVVSSDAYGPDVVELVADVTRAATTPAPVAPRAKTETKAETKEPKAG